MVYEGVLLFGVLFAAELAFDLATQNLNPATLRNWDHLYLFVVLGIYFTYFWGHGGQTLPMQTWHIRLASANGGPVTFKQACLRYCGAWMWFLPALAISYGFNIDRKASLILIVAGMAAWAWTSKLDANGQFLHDKLAGTRLINVPKVPRISDTE
jgi:uncharacterized RDD family membrane protein YckC